jgi:hypothetical protein
MQIVAAFFAASVAGMTLLCVFQPGRSQEGPVAADAVRPAWMAAGIMLLLLAPLVRMSLMQSARRAAADGRRSAAALGIYALAVISGNVLCESSALVGLVMSLFLHELRWCLIFGGAAAAVMLWSFPRRSQIEALWPEGL